MNVGQRMYDMAVRLFPICRSITGDGFRQSLEIIRATVPEYLFLRYRRARRSSTGLCHVNGISVVVGSGI